MKSQVPSKILETSCNHCLKPLPKLTKIEVWMGSGRLLSGSWLSGTSGPPSERFLGSSCAVLEPSWAPLERLFGLCWPRTGASWGAFGDVLGHPRVSWRILVAKWSPIEAFHPGCCFFIRCLIDFASENRSPNFKKLLNSI